MKFVLEIDMGNDAMQTPEDVIEAITRSRIGLADPDGGKPDGSILDANGNIVGEWKFTS